MHEISNDQYFLILSEINLFPELSKDPIQLVEQVMNGLLLTTNENIEEALNRVVSLEILCKQLELPNSSFADVLKIVKPFLENYGLLIARGLEVKAMYPKYTHKNRYFWDVGKQAAINLEFSLAKKLSFNGHQIKFENTFIDWVMQILEAQRGNSQYNAQDKLLYHIIEPQATIKHVETREIIEQETDKYADEIRLLLQTKSEG
mgnify:CR=1 FL=1